MAKKLSRFMLSTLIFLGISLSALLLAGLTQPALARPVGQPALPARFYGQVTLSGRNLATGTLLTVSIGQHIATSTVITLVQGISSYIIDVPGDNPATHQVDGGRAGDEVIFSIPGYIATQKGIWQVGAITALNLTLEPDSTATPTTTPQPQQPVAIPEPVTILLFGMGLVGLAVAKSRRDK
jgi:hypothetical protein